MSSDDSLRAPDRAYAAPGVGMTPQFMCAACAGKCSQRGSGIRLVRGMRSRVCKACKERIDARKAKA